ncbi:MAG: sigma-70 family RNA polymerase sigma factor, partial [Planctomycetota bacterium]
VDSPEESTADPSLRLLAAWTVRGDQEAFATLVHQYGAMVRSTCRRVLGAGEDAEDAVQETFIRLARDAASVRSSLGGWLLVCARAVSINHLASQGARRRRERHVATGAETMNHVQPTPDLDRQDEIRQLEEHLTHLHEDERGVIVDYFWFGMSQEEIGRRHGITQVAAKRRLDRAMEHLRRRMGRSAPMLGALALCALPAVASSRESALVAALRERGLPAATPAKAAATSTTSTLAMIGIGVGLAVITSLVVWQVRQATPAALDTSVATLPMPAPTAAAPMKLTPAVIKPEWTMLRLDTTMSATNHTELDSRPFLVGQSVTPRLKSVYEVTYRVEKRHCPYFCVGLTVTNHAGLNPELVSPVIAATKISDPMWMREEGNHTLRVTVAPPSNGSAEVTWQVDGVEKLRKQVPEAYLTDISLVVCSGRIELLADSGHDAAVGAVK